MTREAQHYLACAYAAGLLRRLKPDAVGAIRTLELTKARSRAAQRHILLTISRGMNATVFMEHT